MKTTLKILAVLFILPGFIFAQNESIRKLTFDTKNRQTLEIHNAFGEIEVTTHTDKKIDVTVVITVDTRNDERAKEFFESTTIDFEEKGNTIQLKTIRNQKDCKVKGFSIDYTVKVPAGTNLDINNRFGDVLIYEPGGMVKVDVSHGDCRLMGITKSTGNYRNEVMVKFGKLHAENIIGGIVNLEHGDVGIERIADSDIDVRFGNGKIGLLEGEIDIKLSHSTLNIDDLGLKMKSLDADVNFSNLRIDGYETEIYNSTMSGSFSNFKFPSDPSVISEKPSMNSVKYQIQGKKAGNNAPQMNIDARHSTVSIK